MRITLFTSNNSRHNYLVNLLSKFAKKLFVVQESKTIFQGITPGNYPVSKISRKYFKNVNLAQRKIFGDAFIDNSKKNISSICLALTGLVTSRGLWNPINKKVLGNFKNYPVVKVLKKRFSIPVYALGDTQAAALGEMYYGNGKNVKNFFYLTVSTGIGGSIIYNQSLFDNKISR